MGESRSGPVASAAWWGWGFGMAFSLGLLGFECWLDWRNRLRSLPRPGVARRGVEGVRCPVEVIDAVGTRSARDVFVAESRTVGANLDDGVWISRAASEVSPDGARVLYVHGFAIHDDEAVARIAAALRDGLHPDRETRAHVASLAVFFWGVEPCLAAYRRDLDLATSARVRTTFRSTLREFLRSCDGPRRCVLVAHSMGSRILLGNLDVVAAGPPGGLPGRIEVVLLNPEIEGEAGLAAIARASPALHFHLLMSPSDGHLTAAEIFGSSPRRLGHMSRGEVERDPRVHARIACCEIPDLGCKSAHSFFWHDPRGVRWLSGVVRDGEARCPF